MSILYKMIIITKPEITSQVKSGENTGIRAQIIKERFFNGVNLIDVLILNEKGNPKGYPYSFDVNKQGTDWILQPLESTKD